LAKSKQRTLSSVVTAQSLKEADLLISNDVALHDIHASCCGSVIYVATAARMNIVQRDITTYQQICFF